MSQNNNLSIDEILREAQDVLDSIETGRIKAAATAHVLRMKTESKHISPQNRRQSRTIRMKRKLRHTKRVRQMRLRSKKALRAKLRTKQRQFLL